LNVRKKLILSDGMRERELQLVGRIVVGRDPACEISHDDSLLSRRHAEFVTAGDAVTVRDLGSRNGVFVNGTRAAEHLLEPGDIVQIGPLRARFVVEHVPSSITPEELDAERTAVFRRGSAAVRAAGPASIPLPSVVPVAANIPLLPVVPVPAAVATDDQEVTRLVPAPRMPTPSPRVDRPYSHPAVDSDDERTEFISAPEVARLQSPGPSAVAVASAASAPPLYVPAVPRHSRAAPVDGELSTFVFMRLLTLAAAILAAAAVPMAMWRRAALDAAAAGVSVSLVWLALPLAVALIGTYVIGALINRRITAALTTGERNRT
jgi:hypothetical protein